MTATASKYIVENGRLLDAKTRQLVRPVFGDKEMAEALRKFQQEEEHRQSGSEINWGEEEPEEVTLVGYFPCPWDGCKYEHTVNTSGNHEDAALERIEGKEITCPECRRRIRIEWTDPTRKFGYQTARPIKEIEITSTEEGGLIP